MLKLQENYKLLLFVDSICLQGKFIHKTPILLFIEKLKFYLRPKGFYFPMKIVKQAELIPVGLSLAGALLNLTGKNNSIQKKAFFSSRSWRVQVHCKI